MNCTVPGFAVLHYLLEFVQTYVHWVSDVIQQSHLLTPTSLPSIFSNIRVFSNESALLIRWPKYWRLSFSISLPNEYSGLISFRIDWLDLLEVQGNLKSFFQNHSWKASKHWHSVIFIVQLSHLYMNSDITIALTIWIFVGNMMSLLLICCLVLS